MIYDEASCLSRLSEEGEKVLQFLYMIVICAEIATIFELEMVQKIFRT